ncbi:hypothetical protein BGI33_12480 [Snodgrassella alvi]|uniref:hypothetical protein n=1 Tax=Snodgrassella alvi TaxID=1196083 RepID=UPI000CAFE51B|nr:hypothetical protein [Snodgrassella alvi]PIT13108.1 hypothetical protein BGI33_12480 [Snodgrassella alvi]PIT15004.1 hypothetical protein BGI34_10565 [Snodgrassella alvi]
MHGADVIQCIVAVSLFTPVQIGLFDQAVGCIVLKLVVFAIFVDEGVEAAIGVVVKAEFASGRIDAGVYQSARVALVVGAVAGRVGIGQ